MTRAQLDAIEQEMEQVGELEKLAIATDLLDAPAKQLFSDAAIYAQGPGSENGDEDDDEDLDDETDHDDEAEGGPGPEEEYTLE